MYIPPCILLVHMSRFQCACTCILCGAGERNRGYALLVTLYRAPTFSLLALHGGIISCAENDF